MLRHLFGLAIDDASPERRGLPAESAAMAERLRGVGEAFLLGYQRALSGEGGAELVAALESEVPLGWRLFGHEGVGFGLSLRDAVLPRVFRATRLREYVEGPGAPFRYAALVGAGWSFARWPRRPDRALAGIDPLLRWISFDGYGFHRAFFDWRATVDTRRVPRRLRGYARRAFDLGVGRCLWFGLGMEPERIAGAIGGFPRERRGPLWSGVGLAAVVAGGGGAERLARLRAASRSRAADLAQGAAFGAMLQVKADEVTPSARAACPALCGLEVSEAAALVERERPGPEEVPAAGNADATEPVYEMWRRRTRAVLRAVDPPA
jgi:enediyne biosynthesis protein E3